MDLSVPGFARLRLSAFLVASLLGTVEPSAASSGASGAASFLCFDGKPISESPSLLGLSAPAKLPCPLSVGLVICCSTAQPVCRVGNPSPPNPWCSWGSNWVLIVRSPSSVLCKEMRAFKSRGLCNLYKSHKSNTSFSYFCIVVFWNSPLPPLLTCVSLTLGRSSEGM